MSLMSFSAFLMVVFLWDENSDKCCRDGCSGRDSDAFQACNCQLYDLLI